MKTYTIGELLDNFNSVRDIAYAFKGKLKGSIIFVDVNNNNILTTIYPDGRATEVMCIRFTDLSKEETREWVFAHEVDIDDTELIHEIGLALNKIYNDFLGEFKELSEEEQEEFLNKVKESVDKYNK